MKQAKTVLVQHTGPGGDIRVRWADVNEERSVADIAAGIQARRMYGRNGTVGALRPDSHKPDFSGASYQAFIGKPDGNGVTGRNVWIYV